MKSADLPLKPGTASVTPDARRPRRSRSWIILGATTCVLAGAGGAAAYLHFREPSDPLQRAEARLDRGDARAARLLALGLTRQEPGNGEAQWVLGKAELRLGHPVAAERGFKAASQASFDPARLRLPLATAILAQHRPQDVLDLLAADGADPADEPAILIAKAWAFDELGQAVAAGAALAEAGRLAPTLIAVPLAAADLAWRHQDIDTAEQQADRALLLDGRSPNALTLKARLMEERGHRQAALELLTKAVTADPKAQQVRLERARMLLSAGRPGDARGDVDVLLADQPTDAAASYLKATLLLQDGDYPGADLLLQRLSNFMPRLPRGFFTLALVKFHLEQLEQAAEAADKYVAAAPGDLEGRKLAARIGLAAHRPERAIEVLDGAPTASAADAEALDLIGTAQEMVGHLADAERSFARAAVLAPQNAGVFAHLGSTRLRQGDTPGAVEALEHSLAIAPEQPDVGAQLVVAAATAGHPEKAATLLAELKRKVGGTAAIERLEATLALAQFDFATAAADLAHVAAEHPANTAITLQWVQVLLMQGRTGDAETALTAALAKEPAQGQALDVLVRLLEQAGRRSRAISVVQAAQAAAPANVDVTLLLAALHVRAGQAELALAALDAPSVRGDRSPRVGLARASAQAAAGQPATARQTYEGLLKSDPARVDVVLGFADFLAAQRAADEAGQLLSDGVKANPGNAELQQALVRNRYRAAGLASALAAADALRRDPANLPAAALLRGDALQAAGKYPEAAAAFQAELATSPSSNLAMRAAAAAQAAHGPAAAVLILRPWVRAHPDDLAALRVLGSMHAAAKDPASARDVLELLLARAPNDPVAMNDLAWIYQELGDARAYPLALRAYLTTFDPVVADTLGCILLSANRTQDALALLRYASRELSTDPSIGLHLARAARQAGLKDEARTLLTALVAQPFDGRATAAQLLSNIEAN